jgi:hypothetical protein
VIATDAERSLPPNARAHVGKVVFKQEDEWLVEVHHRDAALCSLIRAWSDALHTVCFGILTPAAWLFLHLQPARLS